MEKDIITVKMNDGSTKDMELVFHYQDKEINKNYIIYKKMDEDTLYLASYHFVNNKYELDTNLDEKEIKKMDLIFNKYLELV